MTLVWEAAEAMANEVRKRNSNPDGTANLESICELLDARVIYTTALGPGTSGMIIKSDEDDPARIYINANESTARQRFTLAHEIGHCMERFTIANDKEFSFRDYRGKKYDLHEFYADQFAGALLVPEELVRKLLPDFSPENIGSAALDVAAQFSVSYTAAQKRLERLAKQGAFAR